MRASHDLYCPTELECLCRPTVDGSLSSSLRCSSSRPRRRCQRAGATAWAAFAFGEGGGGAFGDSSGNGQTGAITGATWTTGRFGSGLAFDGIDDFATVLGGGFEPTTAMTLEAWVYPTVDANGLDDGGGAIVAKDDPLAPAYSLFTKGRNARFGARISSGSMTEVRAFNDLPLNTWSHLAAVFDGSTVRLYINGTLTAWKPRGGAIAKSTGALRIGGVMQNEVFAGRIDEVRLYRRALMPAEIQADMATPITPLPGPDVTAPSVSITSPTSGNTVAGTIAVTASATDEKGVEAVQFLLDGAPFGAEVTSAPYTVAWDTRTVTNTTHTWSVRARDAAGNVGTAVTGVAVSVYNPATLTITQPATGGSIDGDIVNVAYTTAGDLTGVDHVRFQLADGAQIDDPTFDGQFQLTGVAEGAHVLTAVLVRADQSVLPHTGCPGVVRHRLPTSRCRSQRDLAGAGESVANGDCDRDRFRREGYCGRPVPARWGTACGRGHQLPLRNHV